MQSNGTCPEIIASYENDGSLSTFSSESISIFMLLEALEILGILLVFLLFRKPNKYSFLKNESFCFPSTLHSVVFMHFLDKNDFFKTN